MSCGLRNGWEYGTGGTGEFLIGMLCGWDYVIEKGPIYTGMLLIWDPLVEVFFL